MEVVAIEAVNNRSNGKYAGFYGNEALNQKRRVYGEKFTIRDTPTGTEKRIIDGEEANSEREERQDHVNRKLVKFRVPQDRDAYIKYQDFAPWMTVDLDYKMVQNVRKEQGKIRTADSHFEEAETALPKIEELPEGGHEGDFQKSQKLGNMAAVKKAAKGK